MNYIRWKHGSEIIAGTILRNSKEKENGNLALHVGGDLSAVLENRNALSNQLEIPLEQWVFAQQTHSDHLYKVQKEDAGRGAFSQDTCIPNCDALYTTEKGIALGVFHADCVPILLYDPYTSLICAIHSGWQGTIKAITSKVVKQLIEKEHVNPQNIRAFIGPAIAYHSFEVGADVLSLVEQMSFDTRPFITRKNTEKALIDNRGLNKQMLLDLGVPLENIRVDKNDTFQRNDVFFSYRRDQTCGRHLSFIMMK